MQSHSSQPSAVVILAGLLVLTATEFLLAQIGAGLLLLMVAAFFKLLLVVIYFMHIPRLWTAAADEQSETTQR